MKILQVIPNLLKGGAQRLVIDICSELVKIKNIECMLLVLNYSKNEFQNLSNGINICYINVCFSLSFLNKSYINIEEYEKVVNKFNPDIIHSHLYFAELICHENPRKNIKYVTHFHDNIEQLSNFQLRNIFVKKFITNYYEKKRLLKKYNYVEKFFITISNDCDKFARAVLPSNARNKIIKLENAINHSNFVNPKRKYDINKISLVNIGNLMAKKNQVFILDVVKYLLSKGYYTDLTLVGDGDKRNEILKYSKFLQIENNITMVGSVDNVQTYLWESNFYIHSAIYEPFGLVLLEAMAAKTPIICHNGRGNKDIIINNKTGYLINDLDEKKFGDIIIKLFKNKKLYSKIVENAFEFSKKYDINKYIEKLLKIYKI